MIIGDGPCRNNLETLTKNFGLAKNVHFLGVRENVSELLKLLDIFTLPSIIEGISNTILEAMAAGLPVIATDVGGNPELVEDEKTGCLIHKENIDDLVKAMERYILNQSIMKQHGYAGRERVMNKFSLDRMTSNYETIYTSLIMHNKKYQE